MKKGIAIIEHTKLNSNTMYDFINNVDGRATLLYGKLGDWSKDLQGRPAYSLIETGGGYQLIDHLENKITDIGACEFEALIVLSKILEDKNNNIGIYRRDDESNV